MFVITHDPGDETKLFFVKNAHYAAGIATFDDRGFVIGRVEQSDLQSAESA